MYGITQVLTPDELVEDPDVEVVLNHTPAAAHYGVVKSAILAEKSVFTEKPLASLPTQGDELTRLAAERGVLIGCAPDTFLGAGAWFYSHGNESWHPNSAFSYRPGAGPAHNLGP